MPARSRRKPDRHSGRPSARLFLVCALCFGAAAARAGDGIQLIGFGLDQTALAGAVTADPGSPMTIATNPAGLVTLAPSASLSIETLFNDIHLDARHSVFTLGSPTNTGEVRRSSGSPLVLPQLAAVFGSGAARVKIGFGLFSIGGIDVDFGSLRVNTVGGPTGEPTRLEAAFHSRLLRFSPAVAWQPSSQVAVGVAMNVSLLQLSLRETVSGTFHPGERSGAFDSSIVLEPSGNALGVGLTVGLLADLVEDRIRAGLSYSTGANLARTRFALPEGAVRNPGLIEGPDGASPAGSFRLAFDFPQQAAAGLSVRANHALRINGDVKWINYSATQGVLALSGPAGTYRIRTRWRDVWVAALGVRYTPSRRIELMAGFNHANAPVPENALLDNLVTAVIVKNHVTAGVRCDAGRGFSMGIYGAYSPRTSLAGRGDLTDRRRILTSSDDSGFRVDASLGNVGVQISRSF